MRIVSVAAWLMLSSAELAAEEGANPDLSGTWEFNPSKSRLEMTLLIMSRARGANLPTMILRLWR